MKIIGLLNSGGALVDGRRFLPGKGWDYFQINASPHKTTVSFTDRTLLPLSFCKPPNRRHFRDFSGVTPASLRPA
jgi:hypothetical protein